RTHTDLKALEKAGGELDLSHLDRRQLYAVAANLDGGFSTEEQTAAAAEWKLRLGDALRGPEAAAQLTGQLGGLYEAAEDFLDA
ncbi:hypothetical protein J8J27_32235, partial [Mycobacterium tuberculosis]|nr:hypothetical protein [Mycobacterium tuberculosis]